MVECPECGEEYKSLGGHWRYSPSHRPKLNQKQLEIATGLLMGDGCINPNSKNHCLQTEMTSPNYLRYLDNEFDILSCGVSLKETAAKCAKNARNSGFNTSAKKENYSNKYKWSTRSHPKFNEFREWYSSGEKVWPEDIELTPTVLKHWYVGDGSYNNNGYNNSMKIAMSNEIENTEKVSNYFISSGLPKPSNYTKSKRDNENFRCSAVWTVNDTQKLFEYMGKPLPDFEYKWPEEYR